MTLSTHRLPLMTPRTRATPCIGICSTTYGDLVCRGCKRFAHEVVGWNGYSEAQRERIRERLLALKLAAARSSITPSDPALLARVAEQLEAPDLSLEALVLWLLERCDPNQSLAELGLAFSAADAAGTVNAGPARVGDARRHLDQADAELARAYYERSFKVPVQS